MQFNRLFLIGALAFGGLGLSTGEARADQVSYVGMHPVQTGGFCYIEAPHVHVYAPTAKAKVMYRTHDDAYHFVGDPVAFQYEGPRYTYQGHHPVNVDLTVAAEVPSGHVEYCYLNGPHYHYWWPEPSAQFEVKGGVYWYVGPFAPEYKLHRKRYLAINPVYASITYERPVITVEPPAAYVGVGVIAVGAAVGVGAAVEVHVPQPVLEVDVAIPGVFIETGHHHDHGHGKWKHHKHKGHKGHKGKFRRRFD